jgi:predicted nucleotidyltransferase
MFRDSSLPFEEIRKTIRVFYSEVQAIYLFGSFARDDARKDSDVDLALLLPHERAKAAGSIAFSECANALSEYLNRTVDLINLREVNTVFQHEIVQTGQRLFVEDEKETAIFEMLVLSFYQKLNEERREILNEIIKFGKVIQE